MTTDQSQTPNVIPTMSASLDDALGIQGFPRGSVVDLAGPDGSGKTTLALLAVRRAQRLGHVTAWIDAAGTLDVAYASELGVVVERLLISQPHSGEHAFDVLNVLVRSGAVDLLVVDGFEKLAPCDPEDDESVGRAARFMSMALRKLTSYAFRTGACVIFLNRLTTKSERPAPAGVNALKFYAGVRLSVTRKSPTTVSVRVLKNKFAAPFREADVELPRRIAPTWSALGLKPLGAGMQFTFGQNDVAPTCAWCQCRGEECACESMIDQDILALRLGDHTEASLRVSLESNTTEPGFYDDYIAAALVMAAEGDAS